ncbi:MAG: RHS repeat-associated core domain-containing protein [Planctomyces sp.]|nr:RHS repeat-associated core domain-containing protein [Planctomyces sp.]
MPTTTFVWDPVNDCVISELDGTGTTQAVYTNEPQQYGGVLSQRRGSTSSFLHADALGTTRLLTSTAGATTDTYLFDAWGNPVSSTGSTVNPFRWVGRSGYYTDNATGLLYVRARMYQPTIARWVSVDPLSFHSLFLATARHRYANNRPSTHLDPSGLFTEKHTPPGLPEYLDPLSENDIIPLWIRNLIYSIVPEWTQCETWQCVLAAATAGIDNVLITGKPLIEIEKRVRAEHFHPIGASCHGGDYSTTEQWNYTYPHRKDDRYIDLRSPFLEDPAIAAVLGILDPESLDLIFGRASFTCTVSEKLMLSCCSCKYKRTGTAFCHISDVFDFRPDKKSRRYNQLAEIWQYLVWNVRKTGLPVHEPRVHAFFEIQLDEEGVPEDCP